GVDPPERRELPADERAFEILRQIFLVAIEERAVLVREPGVSAEHPRLTARLLGGVVRRRHAAAGNAGQIANLLQERVASGRAHASECLEAGRPEQRGPAATARESDTDENVTISWRDNAADLGAGLRGADRH